MFPLTISGARHPRLPRDSFVATDLCPSRRRRHRERAQAPALVSTSPHARDLPPRVHVPARRSPASRRGRGFDRRFTRRSRLGSACASACGAAAPSASSPSTTPRSRTARPRGRHACRDRRGHQHHLRPRARLQVRHLPSSSSPSSYGSLSLADMYGIALAALGMLSTLATCLAIDVYGPVCDNAGGIAEMCELPEPCARRRTRSTPRATRPPPSARASPSAPPASSASRSSAPSSRASARAGGHMAVDLLDPITFRRPLSAPCSLLVLAMTMKSVGMAANDMVMESRSASSDLNRANLLRHPQPPRPPRPRHVHRDLHRRLAARDDRPRAPS